MVAGSRLCAQPTERSAGGTPGQFTDARCNGAMTSVAKVQRFVADWYSALDQHVPYTEVREFVADDPIRFVFPEETVTTHDGLAAWYDKVICCFFDESHRIDRVSVAFDGDLARVHVVVNWVTRVWQAPDPISRRLEYVSDQDWEIELGEQWRLRAYVVNSLTPQGDTPELC